MPAFNTEITTIVEVDFDVVCSCGVGLCNQSETRESWNRHHPQVVVEPCKQCLTAIADKTRDEVTDELEARIQELKDQLALLAT